MVHQVHLVLTDLQVRQGQQDLLEHQENQDLLEHLV